MKRITGKVLLALATGVATIAVAPAAASAAPSQCTVGTIGPPYGFIGGTVFCQAGSGQYRAWSNCYNDAGRLLKTYGPWVTRPTISSARCNSTYYSLGAHSYQIQ